jgi:septum formation protein
VNPRPRFILASASPARLATLRAAGLDPEVIVSDVDEEGITGPSPAATAQRLAELKAAAVAGRVVDPGDAVVLGCDSLLELDGRALGKPGTPDVARARWQAMRGRAGILHTGHCVMQPASGRRVGQVASTTVHFADVSDAEIDCYVATGEPLVVAGAFTIDGLGGAFVESIEGDHHNVVGVSLPLLRHLLAEVGIGWPSLWAAP